MIHYDYFAFIMLAISLVLLVFIVVFSIYYLMLWSISGRKCAPVPHSDKKAKFAILIAARGESKVIRNIFNSLKEQTYPKEYFDVWIIVEEESDPSIEIAKEYGYNYFVRDELTDDRHTKGFALQECIRHFKNNNIKYDSYMIFDADNVMDNRYIEVMNDLKQTGVQVGLGNRAFTNADYNWLTVGSSIMFTYMNQVTARGRTILFHKATLMGTGYFVDADIIEEAGGWIFTGMTEDIQLSTYCTTHDIYMRYYPLINFYDEQATTFKVMHMQHLRWVWGYFARRSFLKKAGVQRGYHTKEMQRFMNIEFGQGLIPFIIFEVLSFFTAIICLVFGSMGAYKGIFPESGYIFGLAGWNLFMMYLCFFVPAFITVFRHNDTLKLSKWHCFVGVMTYFFYFMDFPLAVVDGFIHPSKKVWKKIEHTGDIIDKSAKEVSDGK